MPFDKFGIPYWYPSKATAGVTGEGHGFFWEQNNNFRVDEDAGMLRLGKETDDCVLIDINTGEWRFPYLTDGDGLSISGSTGHHTGGETHGCQGFAYMCDTKLDISPPSFRFRKETYHVQYDTHPDGEFTSPFATGPVVNNWKGIGWVRYNKKDGRGPGKDSVILEVWWNDDPVADIKNWKMLKRVEDLGDGVTNWGTGATCDGEAHQVGTWSNIQFRFKSSASDFSLHPLIPETNEGQNIDSIDGEDMSFADSEARGYGKRADMPRDIEMKCLFKWDAGGRGKCHFKNISLREIDSTKTFDDDQNTPPPGQQPGELEEVQGFFKLLSDINTIEKSECSAAGISVFATVLPDTVRRLSDTTTDEHRTRIAGEIVTSSSPWKGKTVKQADFPLEKLGSPGASPVVSAKIWNSAGAVIYTSPTTVDPSTLPTAMNMADPTTWPSFDFSTNTYSLVAGDRIGVEYTGTSSSNLVGVGYLDADTVANTRHNDFDDDGDPWDTSPGDREIGCRLWA